MLPCLVNGVKVKQEDVIYTIVHMNANRITSPGEQTLNLSFNFRLKDTSKQESR